MNEISSAKELEFIGKENHDNFLERTETFADFILW